MLGLCQLCNDQSFVEMQRCDSTQLHLLHEGPESLFTEASSSEEGATVRPYCCQDLTAGHSNLLRCGGNAREKRRVGLGFARGQRAFASPGRVPSHHRHCKHCPKEQDDRDQRQLAAHGRHLLPPLQDALGTICRR